MHAKLNTGDRRGGCILFALLDGEISILVAFATKIVNNIREVQSGLQ